MVASVIDFEALFRWAMSGIIAIGAWVFVKHSQGMVDLESRMNSKFDSLPDTYARRDDMIHMFDQIIIRLDHLQSSIDKKADKSHGS